MASRVRVPLIAAALATAAVLGSALTMDSGTAAAAELMTTSNSAPPAVGGGRVFWAVEHGRHADVRMAAPGAAPKTIFTLAGPHARSAPPYAQIVGIAASRTMVAFTVSAGYGDPYNCAAIEEHPAGDPRCRAGRETFNALYAGPIGGPYRRLSGVVGRRTSRCYAGSAPGSFDVSGSVITYAEHVFRCEGDFRPGMSRIVVRAGRGGGRAHVLDGCDIHRVSSPYNDVLAVAGDYVAWRPDACDRLERIRLYRWRSGQRVYKMSYRWFLDPFDLARDGTVIGQSTVSAGGEDAHGYLFAFPPHRHPKGHLLARFGTNVDALRVTPSALAVAYAPSDSAKTNVLVTSDREGKHRRVATSGLDRSFPWVDFDGSTLVWTRGDPPVRVYAERPRG